MIVGMEMHSHTQGTHEWKQKDEVSNIFNMRWNCHLQVESAGLPLLSLTVLDNKQLDPLAEKKNSTCKILPKNMLMSPFTDVSRNISCYLLRY